MSEQFDAIVVGAGQAGPSLAARLAGTGRKVALIERKLVGGTCVNTGCTPTKTLVASAAAAQTARRAAEFGVTIGGAIGVDMPKVMARKDGVVGASRGGLETWLQGVENLALIRGHARFIGPKTLQVNGRELTARQIFLNVGGRAVVPDYPGVDDIAYLTNSTILELAVVPEQLVIVGGGYVGLEFAQIFRRLGSAVTVVERGERLLKKEDPDTSQTIQEILEGEGVSLRLNADCIGFEPSGSGAKVQVNCTAGEPAIAASHVLLAIGRRPNTDDLGLELAGVMTDKRGFIIVDESLQTSVPDIWALGDCNGRGAFTHTSYNDYEIVAENLLLNAGRKLGDRHPAYALYTDPPLGRVGLTETEARANGRKVLVGKRPMTRVARATEKGDTRGFMKLVVDADSNAILGAAILGVGGDEAIHSVLDLIYAGAPAETLRRAVHIHPTVSELLPTLVGELQ